MKEIISTREILELVEEFSETYRNRPIKRNAGGMGFNHCFATFCLSRRLLPDVIVESGVFMGQSTWILEQACPDAKLICLDPNPANRTYTSKNATYFTDDFSNIDWSDTNTSNALCFFDDHQNAYQRLLEMRWWGFSRAIFEDNFPCGQGDCYSLRHAFANFGHPKIQMSPHCAPKTLRAKVADWMDHAVLGKYYDRQAMVRRPNEIDAKGLKKNLTAYQEFPPAIRYSENNWGGDWTGPYASEPPLFDDFPEDRVGQMLREIENEHPGAAFKYGYICYVEMPA